MATTSIYASSKVEAIPVIDFSDILSGSKDLGNCPQVKELHSALSTVGFVFLTNHGIDKKMVESTVVVATFPSNLESPITPLYSRVKNYVL